MREHVGNTGNAIGQTCNRDSAEGESRGSATSLPRTSFCCWAVVVRREATKQDKKQQFGSIPSRRSHHRSIPAQALPIQRAIPLLPPVPHYYYTYRIS